MEEPGTGAGSSTNFRFAPLRKFPADDYSAIFRPPESPKEPMEFLARSWSISALEVSKALSSTSPQRSNTNNGVSTSSTGAILEELTEEPEDPVVAAGNPFSFASSTTSQLVMERIMSQSQEVSPLTSGRLSHSSGPLNGQSCGSFTDSPPVSPSEMDDNKLCRLTNTVKEQNTGKTVGRWLKDRKEKKKEEARAHNAQVHAAVSVAGVAAAVAAIAAATASSGKNEQQSKTDLAVASAATLVAAQCVEVAESMGAERELLTAVVNSAVNVRTSGDIMTLTAAAATALRGAAILKARALKGVWNVAAVLPAEKGMGMGNQGGSLSGELIPGDNFLGVASQGFLAKGSELLKRTRNGDLHWKLVSVYLNRLGQVMLKMKSRYAAGTIKNKKKFAIIEVCKDIQAWPGRHLVEGGEQRRYFGLKTAARRVIEFECKNQREYDIWTQGVSRLISLANEKNRPT